MNIVFDFGGVVFRWQPQEFMARLLPHHAPDPAASQALVARFFESFTGDWAQFDRGTLAVPDLVPRIVARTGLTQDEVGTIIAAVPDELQPLPQTVALIEQLKARGHRLFFLSNMPGPYADHLEATHSFLQWFEDGLFSARVQLIKPDPAIFDMAVQRFGITPADTLFIDDVAHNVVAAQTAGWQALLFTDPAQCRQALAERGLL